MSFAIGWTMGFANANVKVAAKEMHKDERVTPEGKVKAKVNRLLDKYAGLYRHMPVPYGYGASTLDYLICFRGKFIAIETKAPGKKPTDRQRMIADKIRAAGGDVFVIDGEEGLEQLAHHLESVKHATHPYLSQT